MPSIRSGFVFPATLTALTVLTVLTAAPPALAALLGPNLYVAGDPFTIEQAIDDYLKQRAPQDPKYFKLLVIGAEMLRLQPARASSELKQALQKARREGAQVYVCTKDLKANNLKPADLFQGVRAVRGMPPDQGSENLAAWEKALPRAPDAKMRGICSGG